MRDDRSSEELIWKGAALSSQQCATSSSQAKRGWSSWTAKLTHVTFHYVIIRGCKAARLQGINNIFVTLPYLTLLTTTLSYVIRDKTSILSGCPGILVTLRKDRLYDHQRDIPIGALQLLSRALVLITVRSVGILDPRPCGGSSQ